MTPSKLSLALIEGLRRTASRADKDGDDDLLIAIGLAVAAFLAAIEELAQAVQGDSAMPTPS